MDIHIDFYVIPKYYYADGEPRPFRGVRRRQSPATQELAAVASSFPLAMKSRTERHAAGALYPWIHKPALELKQRGHSALLRLFS